MSLNSSGTAEMIEIPDRKDFEEFAHRNMNKCTMALAAAYQSFKLGRSTNSATIVLLGMSGSGKSHTINNLFSKNITPVSDASSCTKEIAEFTIDMPSENVGISNAKIQVIDTPGFGDTDDGMEFDSRVLANVGQLFEKKNYMPNFIILVVNFNDKRIDGKFAPLVKLLKSMKLTLSKSVLDKKHPNMIVVLTHLCGAVPNLQKDPAQRKILIQKIVHEHLGIPDVPVELGENCCEDYELEKIGDYFELPNQELYPRNLYQSLLRIAKSVDPVGHGIVNEAYSKLQTGIYKITCEMYPIVKMPSEEEFILSEIMRMQVSSSTELEKCLSKAWNQLTPSEQSLCKMVPSEFAHKLALLGYRSRQDLPQAKGEIISFFRQVAPDRGMEMLLWKHLGLEAPLFTFDLFAGRAYDLTRDRATSFTVLSPGMPALATVGCYMPEFIQANDCPEVKFTYSVANTNQESIQERLKDLNIDIGENTGLNFGNREGYNVLSQESNAPLVLTAVYEKRVLKLETGKDAPISPELMSAVQNLPTSYDKQDCNNVQQWKNFFNTYGTHYISTSFVGGSVLFKLSKVANGSTSKSSFLSTSGILLSYVFFGTDGFNIPPSPSKYSTSDVKTKGGLTEFLMSIFESKDCNGNLPSSKTKSNLEIIVRGGNSTKASELALSNNHKDFMERLAVWEDTIWDNPMVTDSSIALAEVADVVNRYVPDVVDAMKNAAEDLYRVRLLQENLGKNVEPTKESDSAANRDVSSSSCLTPETLISTPTGFVRISALKPGDLVLNQSGQAVKVIGINSVFCLGMITLYGFQDSSLGAQPFFTQGHTFVSPSGDLLVQNKSFLENSHPQMETEFNVIEMCPTHIELLSFEDGRNQVSIVSELTSKTINDDQQLYFLAVEGDGTYIANGFVCYHELPKFDIWPKTFETIFQIVSVEEEALTSCKGDFTSERNKYLVKITEKIKVRWEKLIENLEKVEEVGEKESEVLAAALDNLGLILCDPYKVSLGMILYSRCGKFLHQQLDVRGLSTSPFVNEALKILQMNK